MNNGFTLHGVTGTLIVSFAAILFTACSGSSQEKPISDLMKPAPIPVSATSNQAPVSPPDSVKGGQIYATKCLPCHGPAGLADGSRATQIRAQGGQVARIVSSDLAVGSIPSAWFEVVSTGRIEKLMPGFSASLSPQDTWDVLSYVWAMGVQSSTLLSTQQTYIDMCQSCHGTAGLGDGPERGSVQMVSFADARWMSRTSLSDMAATMITGTVHSNLNLDLTKRLAMASLLRTFSYTYADTAVASHSTNTGNGSIRLRAVNRTVPGQVVTGIPVILHSYDSTGEVFSRTVQLDGLGVATFASLPADPNLFYQANVLYSGARFYAAPAQFSSTLELSGTIAVYEVTSDPSVISIGTYHYFVQDVGEGMMNVVEFYIFDNSSDKAYVDKPGADGTLRSIKVNLPDDATNLKFDGPGIGERFYQDGQVIYDSDSVSPGAGASTIAMTYDIPYRSSKLISRGMFYKVARWDVFLPDNIMRISGLTDKGLQPMQTTSVRMYVPESTTINAGGIASFTINGQPRSIPVPGEDNTAIVMGAIALVISIAGAIVLIMRIRSWKALNLDLEQEREEMLQELAEMDIKYSEGKLSAVEYQESRKELKSELCEIWE